VADFVIVTSADLPEAYFLADFLASRGQRFAIVNIVGRPLSSQLRVLARLQRNRGAWYLADLLLARLMDLLRAPVDRRRVARGLRAFPDIDASVVHRIRTSYPCLDCRDPHAALVLDFVRTFGPEYLLLAGAPVLRPSLYGLARRTALNRHLGLVPEFRGSDCTLWAFALDRPERAGYSIHVVNERVDAGDVVLRRPVPVGNESSLTEYLWRLQHEASSGFVDIIDGLLNGAPLPRVAQEGGGRHFPPAGWSIRRRAERNFARLVARRRSALETAASPERDPAQPCAGSPGGLTLGGAPPRCARTSKTIAKS
jgi:folate-dependent phosphoribosylglycinamide formyltransferase PurN